MSSSDKLKESLTSFLKGLNNTVEEKIEQLEAKAKKFNADVNEKRLSQLQKDLEELEKRKR